MGACALLPRIIGQGRAAELLYTGRALGGEEGERWGFFNRLCAPDALLDEARRWRAELAAGPTFAHGMTKSMLHQEWAMAIDAGHRSRGPGAGDVHADRRTSTAPTAPSRAKQKPVFEGELTGSST